MGLFKSAAMPVLLSAFAIAGPVAATPLLFSFAGQSITGPVTASFQLDSNPTPDRTNDQPIIATTQIFFDNVPGIFNGVAQTASTIAFGTGFASQFQILGSASGFAQFGGETVFTGSLSNPIFSPGTYNFTGFSRGTLTISEAAAAVPEPATWALMLGGFGIAGYSLRSRRKAVLRAVSA